MLASVRLTQRHYHLIELNCPFRRSLHRQLDLRAHYEANSRPEPERYLDRWPHSHLGSHVTRDPRSPFRSSKNLIFCTLISIVLTIHLPRPIGTSSLSTSHSMTSSKTSPTRAASPITSTSLWLTHRLVNFPFRLVELSIPYLAPSAFVLNVACIVRSNVKFQCK